MRLTSKEARKCLGRAALACLAALGPLAHAGDNPIARAPASGVAIDGAWNGADLEDRTGCTKPENDGRHGTYAEFDLSHDANARVLGLNQTGITGLTCTYSGSYRTSPSDGTWSGHYSCSDGKQGTFHALGIAVLPNALSIHLAVLLDTTETCTIDAVIGGARF